MNNEAAGALLRDVARLHGQVQRENVACCGGTTPTQCTLLTELGRNGPTTLAELSRRVGLDKSWTSRAVDGLVDEGLLTKAVNPHDRRTITIALSAMGNVRYAELNQTLNHLSERMMRHIPIEQQANVANALQLLLQALEAEVAAGPVGLCEVQPI